MFAPDKILYERFQKNGKEYECVISPKEEQLKYGGLCLQFHIILKLPDNEDFIQFDLFSLGDGHWLPDNRNLADPWLADTIGRIIVENF